MREIDDKQINTKNKYRVAIERKKKKNLGCLRKYNGDWGREHLIKGKISLRK